jgi:tetratricopeptide (TPR) repeat protein
MMPPGQSVNLIGGTSRDRPGPIRTARIRRIRRIAVNAPPTMKRCDFCTTMVVGTLFALGVIPAAAMSMNGMDMRDASATPEATVLGTVSFATSCKSEQAAEFNHGVALLHSFWLNAAEKVFAKIAAEDPQCAMAYWGIAMTDFNQVNGGPTMDGVRNARSALAKADAAREKDSREAGYLAALHRFFDKYTEGDFNPRSAKYSAAMAVLARDYPEDLEAQVFYALSLVNLEWPKSATLANHKKALTILLPLFEQHPDHPGIAHYIIHASDHPQMAIEGLNAARKYASIAPAAPHALHMPSHIFARLGLWHEDIQSNLASKAAAEANEATVGAENRLHAMQFLQYAYLQTGEYTKARAMMEQARNVPASKVDPRYPTYYAGVQAYNPFLFAVESRDWSMALSLKPGKDDTVTYLAHAIAAGHLHDSEAGRAAARSLVAVIRATPALRRSAPDASLPSEVRAWTRYARGDLQGAVALLRPVADRQEILGKDEVELPAREMLAEILFLNGRYSDALVEYQRSLKSDPNRFNGLLGAAESAEHVGNAKLAADLYRQLLSNCPTADGAAAVELQHARAFLDSRS